MARAHLTGRLTAAIALMLSVVLAAAALTAALPAAAVLAAAPSPLGAAAPEVPQDVADWFTQEAAPTIMATIEGMVVVDDDERPRAYATVEVGSARQVHRWSDGLVAGDDDASPLTPIEEWVAPFEGDGRPAGVVTAWREDGEATLAQFDDNSGLSRALMELAPEASYVVEPRLHAHFALVGRKVLVLDAPAPTESGDSVALESFAESLPVWLAEAGAASAVEPEPQPRPWIAATVVVAAAGAVVVVGLLIARAWRRTRRADGRPGIT